MPMLLIYLQYSASRVLKKFNASKKNSIQNVGVQNDNSPAIKINNFN